MYSISHGNDSYGDRARKPWRDYHADWLYNDETKKLTDPPRQRPLTRNAPHVTTRDILSKTDNGDYIAGAVNDENGEFENDGDGIPNEINIGCEVAMARAQRI